MLPQAPNKYQKEKASYSKRCFFFYNVITMKKNILKLVGAMLVLLTLFLTTDPQKLPSIMLILPFIIFFLLIFFAAKWVLVRRIASPRKATRVAVLSAALPTLLFVLLSLGQLTVKDVATTAILFILSYFYISRNSFERQ